MTNRFWHIANLDGTGTGNVVQTEMDYKLMESMYGDVSKEWINHTASRPVTHHCDPSNPVGWIEGEEVYQVRIRKCERGFAPHLDRTQTRAAGRKTFSH